MVNDNIPLKPYTKNGYVISKSEKKWRAVDPKTGDVKYTSVYPAAVEEWTRAHPNK